MSRVVTSLKECSEFNSGNPKLNSGCRSYSGMNKGLERRCKVQTRLQGLFIFWHYRQREKKRGCIRSELDKALIGFTPCFNIGSFCAIILYCQYVFWYLKVFDFLNFYKTFDVIQHRIMSQTKNKEVGFSYPEHF